MIYFKSKAEIALMREAGAIVRDALLLLQSKVREGITTKELDRIAEKYIRSCKAEPSFLGYNDYPASVCISINEQVVHGIPSSRVIAAGDVVSFDIGAIKNGWQGDAARTAIVGEAAQELKDLVRVTEECFFKGVEQFVEDNHLGDISYAIQAHAEAHGYGVVRALVGHGIGRKMHEDPAVPNYGRPGHGTRLKSGLALAIEPMINLGTYDVDVLDDGWTVITADKLPSAHYENTVILTDNGVEITTL